MSKDFSEFIRYADSEHIPWMWRSELPMRYKNTAPIDWQREDDHPIILRGSRIMMDDTAQSRRRFACRFVEKYLRRIKFTCTRDEMFDHKSAAHKVRDRVESYCKKRWPLVRYVGDEFLMYEGSYFFDGKLFFVDRNRLQAVPTYELSYREKVIGKIIDQMVKAEMILKMEQKRIDGSALR